MSFSSFSLFPTLSLLSVVQWAKKAYSLEPDENSKGINLKIQLPKINVSSFKANAGSSQKMPHSPTKEVPILDLKGFMSKTEELVHERCDS